MTTTPTMITKITMTITTINLPHKILDNHCFQFLLGITVVLREIEDNGHAFFFLGWGGGINKVHYGLCENGKWPQRQEWPQSPQPPNDHDDREEYKDN